MTAKTVSTNCCQRIFLRTNATNSLFVFFGFFVCFLLGKEKETFFCVLLLERLPECAQKIIFIAQFSSTKEPLSLDFFFIQLFFFQFYFLFVFLLSALDFHSLRPLIWLTHLTRSSALRLLARSLQSLLARLLHS